MAAIIANEGEDDARAWATGLLANLARPPAGGDTDQLKGLVSGECDIAVANTYYFARALDRAGEGVSEGIDNIGWVFPNQETTGAHVNIAAAGVAAHAPHPDAAISLPRVPAPRRRRSEYFANQNYEFPAGPGGRGRQIAASLGEFRSDNLNLSLLGENQPQAQPIFNEIGFPYVSPGAAHRRARALDGLGCGRPRMAWTTVRDHVKHDKPVSSHSCHGAPAC